jgi:hypothetical protein
MADVEENTGSSKVNGDLDEEEVADEIADASAGPVDGSGAAKKKNKKKKKKNVTPSSTEEMNGQVDVTSQTTEGTTADDHVDGADDKDGEEAEGLSSFIHFQYHTSWTFCSLS